jgi:hypothetical protein
MPVPARGFVMLVFGDLERVVSVDAERSAILDALEAAELEPRGLARHAALVEAFIALSELVQGLADAEHAARGCDERSPMQEDGMALLLELAHALHHSWRGGFVVPGGLPSDMAARLSALQQREPIRTKTAEGYAFYALYPESYLEAALRSGLGPETRVIGIRSIGTGLATLVAAGLGAKIPVTVRPTGHPFRREVRIGAALEADLIGDGMAAFAIVDEGPGLSGSSFGAVADWLEAREVARERIHFFPSHKGDLGPQASPLHRDRWATAQRHCVEVDEWLLGSSDPAHRLESWLTDLIGPLDAPLDDISGGRWRKLVHGGEGSWPPSNTQQERRKFLARAGGETWLVKFAGLGRDGVRKLAMARALQGFIPKVAGLCHGFLVQHWTPARPFDPKAFGRGELIARIGGYLGLRARALEAEDAAGASCVDLAGMAVHNTRLALGDAAATALESRLGGADWLEARVRRVRTDNRLQLWEWLVTDDGRLVKADALDHCAAHDLVGCQDIAWDVAAAVVEFDLTAGEQEQLCAHVESASGEPVRRDLLALLLPCYVAFQLGAWTLSTHAVGAAEAERVREAARSYEARLRTWLTARPCDESEIRSRPAYG